MARPKRDLQALNVQISGADAESIDRNRQRLVVMGSRGPRAMTKAELVREALRHLDGAFSAGRFRKSRHERNGDPEILEVRP